MVYAHQDQEQQIKVLLVEQVSMVRLRLAVVMYLVQVAGAVLLLSALTDHKHKVVLVEQV
jgi:hypothetical protein